jgi:hypothetical protein
MRLPRALIMLVLACLLAVLTAKAGASALLTVLPLVGMIVLLVSGRYVGEAQILRRYARSVPVTRRRVATSPRPRSARVRSVFARTAMTRRGPPVGALA